MNTNIINTQIFDKMRKELTSKVTFMLGRGYVIIYSRSFFNLLAIP